MTVEDQVYERLSFGEQPNQTIAKLGIRRDQYYSALDSLTQSGILSAPNDLPDGCAIELCPPQEAIDLFTTMAENVGWAQSTINRLRSVLARYGCVVPQTPDQRYNRSRWTGQAVRRVDFDFESNHYMVVGFLAPRSDNQSWNRAVPKWRVVYVERNGDAIWSNPVVRGSVVNVEDMAQIVDGGTEEMTNVALAIAYVAESRALLAHNVKDNLGGNDDR